MLNVMPEPKEAPAEPPPKPLTLEDLRAYVRWMKRVHSDLTQRRIADLAGVHKSSIARLELGKDVKWSTGAAVLRALVEHQEANLVPPDAPVEEIMTSPVASAWPDWTLRELDEEMASQRFTWMPLRDNARRYRGLVHRDRPGELVEEGVDPEASVWDAREELVTAEVPARLDPEHTVEQVRKRLEREPAFRLVERWGKVVGVVTPDNLRRVDWRGG